MARPINRLIFVFQANSGTLGAFVDSAKKLLMIKGCTLCQITHGLIGERGDWQDCKTELGVPVDYVHLDEITPQIEKVLEGRTPAILADAQGELRFLIGPDVLERCRGSVADLRGRIGAHAAGMGLTLS